MGNEPACELEFPLLAADLRGIAKSAKCRAGSLNESR